jgi:hypothetical protein
MLIIWHSRSGTGTADTVQWREDGRVGSRRSPLRHPLWNLPLVRVCLFLSFI